MEGQSQERDRGEVEQLRERVRRLESTVDTLVEVLQSASPDQRAEAGTDQYDAHVLASMQPGESYRRTQIAAFYREAGLRDTDKMRQRVRDLRKRGVLQTDGKQLRLSELVGGSHGERSEGMEGQLSVADF